MQTGTIFSGVGHAGLILWVLVGDWLFPARPVEEVIITSATIETSAEFDMRVAASVPTPSEAAAAVRPEARPEEVAEPLPEPQPEPEPEPVAEPEPVPEPEPQPEPNDLAVAEEEQLLPSESTEIQPLAEAEEIVAPDPVQPEVEAETSNTPEPAVAEDPAAETVIEDEPTEATVAEDTGDVTQTEANEDQTAETGMTTSPRPRVRPEETVQPEPEPEAEVEVASAEVPDETPPDEPVAEPTTDTTLEDLLGEAVDQPVEEPPEEPVATGGQDLPQGPPLSGSEMSNISSAVARKWNLGASSTDTMRAMVVIRVTFGPDGRPTGFELIESDGPTQVAVDQLFQTAQRAVNRAYADGGLPLPPEKYDTWRVMDLVFDANGMTLR